MTIKAVIFDYWNTLAMCSVNEEILLDSAKKVHEFLVSKGYNISFEDYYNQRENKFWEYEHNAIYTDRELTPEESFKKFILSGFEISGEDIAEVIKLNEIHDHKSVIREELEELLIYLNSKGIKLGIITNAWHRMCKRELEDQGLLKYFDSIIMSCEVGYRKPAKEIFDISFQQLGVSADECIFVGDSSRDDILGSINAGVKFAIGIEPFDKRDIDPLPHKIINNLSEIKEFLD